MHTSDPFERFKKELASLDQNQSKLVDYGLGPEQVTFRAFPGASHDEIIALERDLGLGLPRSFKQFLAIWNGVIMYEVEGEFGIKVFGTNDLRERNRIWVEYELYPEERMPKLLIFADWRDGDYSVFDASQKNAENEYPVLDGNHEFSPQKWEVICHSFAEWLNRLIEDQGNKFWLRPGYIA